MAAQQHKIMRQVLELHGCPADAAAQWQSALRDSYGQRLLPLIEAACSALGSSGRIDRIDRLEIDLGTVPPASLDAALGAQLDACFSAQLAAAIRSAPQGDAALELFSHFIASGCLPWWADADDRGLLDANLQDLLARSPVRARCCAAWRCATRTRCSASSPPAWRRPCAASGRPPGRRGCA
jgi:hypothetical protein